MNELAVLESTIYFKTKADNYDDALTALFDAAVAAGIDIIIYNAELRNEDGETIDE